MEPQGSPSTVAAVVAEECAEAALSSLPLFLMLHIFSLLPVDQRLRCAEVCRDWRSALAERSLWTRLDVSVTSGVREPAERSYDEEGDDEDMGDRPWDALLCCAAARAGGTLQSLHVDREHVSHAALLEVAAANADALRELHAHTVSRLGFDVDDQVQALLAAAPRLRVLATDLNCEVWADTETANRALRNEAPFGPLRVRRLRFDLRGIAAAGVNAFIAAVGSHASLTGLTLRHAPLDTPAALDAVVDAALARRLQRVRLYKCLLSPASAPALARLLSCGALTELACTESALLDAPAARVLGAALRANSTLTSLTLDRTGVFADASATAELLGALTGHASLRMLCLRRNQFSSCTAPQAAAGAALGALVAANAPALTELDVSCCYDLRDDGLRPLLEALPAATHLRKLDCSLNDMTEALAADVLLPAVRANASLRALHASGKLQTDEAERIVRSRAAAGGVRWADAEICAAAWY
jgi:hypothetical protein